MRGDVLRMWFVGGLLTRQSELKPIHMSAQSPKALSLFTDIHSVLTIDQRLFPHHLSISWDYITVVRLLKNI